MRKMKRCLILLLAVPLFAVSVSAETVEFRDYDATTGTFTNAVRECALVTSATTELIDGGWYAVQGTVACGVIEVRGAAQLDPTSVEQADDGKGLVIPVPATAEKGFMVLRSSKAKADAE